MADATRRTIIVGVSAVWAGCLDNGRSEDEALGDEDDAPTAGEVNQMGNLTLSSDAFDHGEQIPERYGYEANNVNPPLAIENVPEEAESLVLIVDDPDGVEPAGKIWDHWIVWNIPSGTTSIPEDWNPTDAEEGTNDYGEIGYGGPNPPDTEHRYRFKLFAVDTMLDLSSETDAEELGKEIDGHIIAQTQLDGTYPA